MSERGSNSDEERAVVVEDKAENNNNSDNNNNNNNNNEAAEDAALDQHQRDHSGLLTIGEKCVHLICEFIRMFGPKEVVFAEVIRDGAVCLSRLSRTCRTLYIYVRNLPSVLEQMQPPFRTLALPRRVIGFEVSYWSDVAGVVWDVRKPQQLLSLTAPPPTKDLLGPVIHRTSTNCGKERADVLLGNLFLQTFNLKGYGTLNAAERAEVLRILEQCGGLSFSVYDVDGDPMRNLGLDLRRCKNLRYLHAFMKLEQGIGCEQYERLLREFAEMETKPQYASMTVTDSRTGTLTNLSTLSGFRQIRTYSTINLRSLEGVQDARFVSLRNLCLTDVSALAHVHTVELIQSDSITDVSALGTVHNLSLSYCCCVTDLSALGSVHTLKLSFCDGVSDVSALGSVHTLSLNGCLGITDVSNLAGVNSLRLSMCRNVTNASTLVGKIPHFVL